MLIKYILDLESQREYTDEGFLKVPARISSTGIQEYSAKELGFTDLKPGDRVRVYRPPSEVFSSDSLESFANKTVTDNHPEKMVSSKNVKKFAVGFSGADVFQDGDFVKTILHITDESAIKKIESGKVELSNGYTADIGRESGVTPDGLNFDAVQRNIRGNHIALVAKGRAGEACRIADSLGHHIINEDKTKMAKVKIKGVDFEVTDQVLQAVELLKTRLADAEKTAEEMKKDKADKEEQDKKDKKDADNDKDDKETKDALQAKLDDALTKVLTDSQLDTLVESRRALVDSVVSLCPNLEYKGKTMEALKREVVLDKFPKLDKDKSDAYIDARFDILVESKGTQNHNTLDSAMENLAKNENEKVVVKDTRSIVQIARGKFQVATRDAYKKVGVTK